MKMQHLERLMGGRLEADAGHAAKTVGVSQLPVARMIEVSRIVADPSQPRREFDDDDLERLAGSLRDIGQQQPVRVRWDGTQTRWVIISGERRWRAAQRAGMTSLMAVVEERALSDSQLLEAQMVENCVRSDLSAVEAGHAYRTLMTTWQCSQQELAARLHVSASKVSRALATLDLPAEVQREIAISNRGGTAAVQRARRRPGKRSKRAATSVRLVTPAGAAVITPNRGRTVVEVLAALLEQEQKREAA